ncbi:MAG: ribonuclease [Pseudomonadota bacterium]
MAEWIIERGIGEHRAALIDGDTILEARILPDGELVAGSTVRARLIARMPERGQGIVAWDGHEALVAPLPAGVTQGAECWVEITRPAIPEPGKPKRARARPVGGTSTPSPVRSERSREVEFSTSFSTALETNGERRVLRVGDPDLLEAAGWSELLDEAATAMIRFPGGALSLHLTPAMTLIDIDGTLAPSALSIAGTRAAAYAIRRLDISGSIGIDLPGTDKASRHAAAEAIDAILPQPFERTAVNGFGFVQIVRPRRRRSLPEILAMEPALAQARALLRRAERTGGAGERTIAAHPSVITEIERRPDWIAELARRIGTSVALRPDPALAISSGHVQARFA